MANNSINLKLAGVTQKTVVVSSLNATVLDLKAEIAKSNGLNNSQDLKLIVGGKRLQDDSKPLREYGVTASSRILVLGVHSAETQQAMSDQEAQGREQQERAERLQRLKSAAEALAKRSGSNTVGREEHYDLTLENQHGDAIVLDKGDQESLIMGMSLQDKGKLFMKQGDFRGALDVLLLSEEAFSCCKSAIKDSADNEGLLMLDIVWCYFQLRDAASLGAATERLTKARACLQRSHGPNLERMKVLHGDFSPELATYIRLDLLEGVAAFYAGDKIKAKAALDGAQAKWQRLQVSDDRLAELLGMGFTSSEATRGLRFCGGVTDRAISFIMEQRRLAQEREDKQRQERRLRREQRKYGNAPNGQRVDMQLLERLCLLGYDRPLAAEALRQVNNDIQVALDVLSDPMANQALQQHLATVKQASKKRSAPALDDADVAALVSMGFPETDARAALEHCTGATDLLNAAMEHLFSMTAHDANPMHPDAEGEQAGGRAASAPVESEEPAGPSAETQYNGGQQDESPATSNEGSGRDEEMEGELTSAANSDPMAAYDVDVTEEGQAIQEYMFLLNDSHA